MLQELIWMRNSLTASSRDEHILPWESLKQRRRLAKIRGQHIERQLFAGQYRVGNMDHEARVAGFKPSSFHKHTSGSGRERAGDCQKFSPLKFDHA
jgi:hypothetical protein